MVCPRALLIIDDLLAIPPDKGLDLLQDYLLMHSHHQQLSVLFTVQNPFVRPTRQLDLVTLSRQVLFSISKKNNFFLRRNRFFFSLIIQVNIRIVIYSLNDYSVLGTLNRKLFPEVKNFLVRCMEKARERGWNYLFIHTDPFSNLPRKFITMSGIFSDERKYNSPTFFELGKV